MSQPDAAHRLAAHAAGLRFADIPPAAVAKAKVFILDTLGVGIAGGSVPEAAPLLATAGDWGQGNAAAVWGTHAAPGTGRRGAGQRLPDPLPGIRQPARRRRAAQHGDPAARAAGGGRDPRAASRAPSCITAVVAGVDVACSLGLAARQGWRFFRPATSGGFGAVAGLARLRGFDAARTLAAFGMQLGQASGTMQAHTEGSPLLPLQIGFNARAAIQSCDLAAAGFPGLDAPFEGRFGYLPLFEGAWDCAPVLAELGQVWRVTELSHKPFPSGRATHGGVDAVMALRDGARIRAG